MNEWALAFFGGLIGSAHCVGMCGGFVVTLGVRGQGRWRGIYRQLVYAAGRVFTYSIAGVVAGFAGLYLKSLWPSAHYVPSVLALVAGVTLLYLGLESAGVMPRWRAANEGACFGPSLFSGLYGASRAKHLFLAGMVNGFLPCGLVYAYLGLAFSTADVSRGGLTMLCFGMGTVPALAALGAGASLFSCSARHKLMQCAAWCVVITGVICLYRGLAGLSAGPERTVDCPLCSKAILKS